MRATPSWLHQSGNYTFTQLTGVSGTGDYTVSPVLSSGFKQISKNPSTIAISRGGIAVNGINFTVALM